MSGKAATIVLTKKQKTELEHIKRSRTAQQRWIARAKIILLSADGMLNSEISSRLGLDRQQVGLWRHRWQQSQAALLAVELNETKAELRRAIEDTLSDAPRSGSPGKFTPDQFVEIVAVACEEPKLSTRPIDYWARRELQDEIVKRGIVPSISQSHIGKVFRPVDL